jgi:hypothetical protein
MNRLCMSYAVTTGLPSETPNWRDCPGFAQCQIWLYNFLTPTQIHVESVPAYTRETVISDAFVIGSSRVLGGALLETPRRIE